MNLRDLQYVVAVADARHFGRAAEACHVSQPTLSAQIRKLEETLGVTLFERRNRGVLVTEAGHEIVARARDVVAGAREIEQFARQVHDPLAGKLSLAFIPTVGPYLMPHIVPALRDTLPRLSLTLAEHKTADSLALLRGGQLDVGIMALPHGEARTGLAERALFDEPFVAALPARHRLTRRKRLDVADLSGEPLLLLEDGHCLRDQALEVCALAGIDESTDFRATSLETLRQMVAAGAGVTLLPALACAGPFAGGDIALRPFSKRGPKRTVGAVWRESTARPDTIAAVCDVIAEAVANCESTLAS